MKKFTRFLMFCLLPFSIVSWATDSIIGETASYKYNRGRTSLLILGGKATASVKNFESEGPYAPGYVVELEYDVEVLFKGRLKGKVGLLVPERVFQEEFAAELAQDHPQKVGGFHMDYLGLKDAKDADGKLHKDCHVAKVYNIDLDYKPTPIKGSNGPKVLYHKTIGPKIDVKNLSIVLKVDYSVPVLGAVQLDIFAKAMGIDVNAGFDFTIKKK
jgi:hypothetical protein